MNSSTNSIFLLPLASIRIDCGIQQREEMLDAGVVSEYARAMSDGSQFPPVVVYHDGADHWLADGFHRVEAADEAKIKTIAAEIRQGSKRDATLFACGANRDHGLRRSRVDVRRAIETMLTDEEWAGWGDRKIAECVGASHPTVANVRRELEGQLVNFTTSPPDPSTADIEEMEGDDLSGTRQAAAMMKGETVPPAPPPPAKRTGRDGKNYPTTKAKPTTQAKPAPTPAPKPAPAVNKGKVAMQAAHGVAAALVALQPLENDLLPEDGRMVIANLRATLARLEERFGLAGMEAQGNA